MTDCAFQLRHVSKRFTKAKETITIFEGLDLDIPAEDYVAIMGPSGSGKTTLLNVLGGIDQVTDGEVLFNGQRVDTLSESQLARWRANNIGFIFQFYNLMPVLTAAQNVELPLLLTSFNTAERRRRVEIALSLVNLSERSGHYPRELSGGQQQRVAIARAIVSDPQVLLCDEPTGDLDRSSADEVLKILKLLNEEHGKTIIVVTHDPEAAAHAKRILHLNKGVFVDRTVLT
jgi:putative ABC transport system ATP-binding protein